MGEIFLFIASVISGFLVGAICAARYAHCMIGKRREQYKEFKQWKHDHA